MQTLINLFIPHRQNAYRPHLIRNSGLAILIAFFLGTQLIYNVGETGEFKVLGYATNVSTAELHSLTNQNRASNGLPALTLNGALSSAAQSKASHMIANDYWAHVAPDGTTPWYFISAAGYSYTRAGENLAYGYSTSSGVITGWMNSPSHAANILDSSFSEVGFGFANGANYQGGENTVVVAMYAQPINAAPPAPAPSPEPIVTQEFVPETIVESTEPEPEPEPEPVEEIADDKSDDQEIDEEFAADQRYLARLAEDGTVIVTGQPASIDTQGEIVTNFEALLTGQAHWALYLSLGSIAAAGAIFLWRHLHAIHQLVKNGEHYVEGHPLLEASIVYLAIWFVMAATYGAVL